MAIATSTALIGAAVVGAGATAYGASKASKAAKKSAQLQSEANDRALEFQREVYNQTRADNETRRQVGDASLRQLSSIMGLSVPAASANPMIAPSSASRTSAVGSQGFGGYNTRVKPSGGPAGVSPMASPVSTAAGMEPTWNAPLTTQASAAGAPDWNAYLQANPDVAAEAAQEGWNPAEYAAFHYQTYGQGEGRTLPTTQAAAESEAPWVDPTSPGGYMIGPRPEAGDRPSAFTYAGPDLSLSAFRASPDYEFRVKESERALGNLMSAHGGVFSGQRIKAALERSQNLADAEYTDWRNFTMAKANADRAFDYGMNRDTTRDYEVDRARSDGLYDDDRRYTTGRYDTRNQTLLNLAGFGPQATSSNQNAAQSFANNAGALMTDSARARGDAGIAGANAWNQGLGNIMNTGAYLIGSGAFGGGNRAPQFPQTYNI